MRATGNEFAPNFGIYRHGRAFGNTFSAPVYTIERMGDGALTRTDHTFHGNLLADNYLKLRARFEDNDVVLSAFDMELGVRPDGTSRNFNVTAFALDADTSQWTLAGSDYVPSKPFTIISPQPIIESKFVNGSGFRQTRIYGNTIIDNLDARNLSIGSRLILNEDESSNFAAISLRASDPAATSEIETSVRRNNNDQLIYEISEARAIDNGGGAFLQPLFSTYTSTVGGAGHTFEGRVKASGLYVMPSDFDPLESGIAIGAQVNIELPEDEDFIGLRSVANSQNATALEVQSANGRAIDALGDVSINLNSNLNRVQLTLEEEGFDYARLQFSNTTKSAYWHLAGLANDVADKSAFNLYYDDGSSGRNVLTVDGAGTMGLNTAGFTREGALHIVHTQKPTQGFELFNHGNGLIIQNRVYRDNGGSNLRYEIQHGLFDNLLLSSYDESEGEMSLKAAFSPEDGEWISVVSSLQETKFLTDDGNFLSRLAQLRTRTNLKATNFQPGLASVRKVFPELVTRLGEEEYLLRGRAAATALAAAAEQQRVIDVQAEKIESLEARIARLEKLIEAKK